MQLLLALVLVTGVTPGTDPQTEFNAVVARYQQVNYLNGDFSEIICSSSMGYCQQLSGKFWLARPNLMRFEVASPEKQVIVGDGEITWLFWPDSNLVRKIPGSTNPFFEALLGDSEQIFQAESLSVNNGIITLLLVPSDSMANFQSVKLQVTSANHDIVGVEVDDGMGNETTYTLLHVAYNARPSKTTFQFTPPPNAVVEE
jgi:chaperone LolA